MDFISNDCFKNSRAPVSLLSQKKIKTLKQELSQHSLLKIATNNNTPIQRKQKQNTINEFIENDKNTSPWTLECDDTHQW